MRDLTEPPRTLSNKKKNNQDWKIFLKTIIIECLKITVQPTITVKQQKLETQTLLQLQEKASKLQNFVKKVSVRLQ